METRTRIKTVISAENTTLTNIIRQINEKHPDDTTTAQNITNKLARKTIKFDEVAEIMNVLGYDIVFRSRSTGKEY